LRWDVILSCVNGFQVFSGQDVSSPGKLR
jgi:hypothetical protein